MFTPIKKEKKKIRASVHQSTQASEPKHHRKGSLQRWLQKLLFSWDTSDVVNRRFIDVTIDTKSKGNRSHQKATRSHQT
jgi:hypothetical protein